MTLNQFWLASLGCCALTACAPKDAAEEPATEEEAAGAPDAGADEPAAAPTDQDLCNAADYQSFVGSNIAAVTLPAGLNHRVLGPNDVATMDYSPERLNIMTDKNGVIIEVKCG